MRSCVYPGTFDPVTVGHVDIVKRAAAQFDKVYVALLINAEKTTLFTLEQRLAMLKAALGAIENIEVESFSGLLVDYVQRKNAGCVVRGLRTGTDFEYEMTMAATNRRIMPMLETLFLAGRDEYRSVSSTMARELIRHSADVSGLVPAEALEIVGYCPKRESS